MKQPTQSQIVAQAINRLIDSGLTDKSEIFTKVVDELKVPRPTVRRVARDLRKEMEKRVKILGSDLPEVD